MLAGERTMTGIGYAVVFAAGLLFFFWILPACFPFPWADDWFFVPPFTDVPAQDFIWWLLAPHNVHRIPLQKLVYAAVLPLSGYDFRWIIGFNFIIAGATALVLMRVAQLYRGRQVLGDLAIPLLALNPADSWSMWAFGLQFLSSTFFTAIFLWFMCLFYVRGRSAFLNAAILMLGLCALCGMNGLIVASVLSGAVACLFVIDKNMRPWNWFILTLVVALEIALWVDWRSADLTVDPNHVFAVFYGLLSTGLQTYAWTGTAWKTNVIAGLALAGFLWGIRNALKQRKSLDLVMLATLVATLCVMASVSVGSAKGPVIRGILDRYGYLTVLLPIVSWMIVSANASGLTAAALSVSAVLFFGSSYWVNLGNRFLWAPATAQRSQQIAHEIASSDAAETVVDANIKYFFSEDNPNVRALIAAALKELRVRGGKLYHSTQ
jgi:hypothetical protein